MMNGTEERRTREKLDSFERAYIECVLWSSFDESGEPLDRNYEAFDFSDEASDDMRDVCAQFLERFSDVDLDSERETESPEDVLSLAGHDLWLSRNGHGAGFTDGDWREPFASQAAEFAAELGKAHAYVGRDCYIYFFEG